MTSFRLSFTACLTSAALAVWIAPAIRAEAQISFSTAVDLSVANSPKVKGAEDELRRTHAVLAQTKDPYIPSVNGVTDLAESYGPPLGQPTLFSFTANSLIYNAAQRDYIRSARLGMQAAELALTDARIDVSEDAATTYFALDAAQQRHAILLQQSGFASRLTAIVQARIDAGQDAPVELIRSRRTAAQIRLQLLLAEEDIAYQRGHLSRLMGLPDGPLATVPDSIPTLATPASENAAAQPLADTPGVAAAFLSANAKRVQADGDKRYILRPQITFFAEYSRFSTFNNYQVYYPAFNGLTLNAIAVGIQLNLPVYDRMHHDKVKESYANADHAEHDAMQTRNLVFDGRAQLAHAAGELAVRAELAGLDQQLAEQQLQTVLLQLNSAGGSNAPQMTPKDEQNARIDERQRALDLLDANLKLRQAQIHLLRQENGLADWLKAAANATPTTLPATPEPHPKP